MKVTRNEELAEESEKKLRLCNLIIHGVAEASSNDKSKAKTLDDVFVTDLSGAILVTAVTFKSVTRIGKTDLNKKRPIKVVLNNEADKNKIMTNLRNLKGLESFKGISVIEDYTINERRLVKDMSDKAKEYNDKESPDSNYIWRVRGSPKNGLIVKKLRKQRSAITTLQH